MPLARPNDLAPNLDLLYQFYHQNQQQQQQPNQGHSPHQWHQLPQFYPLNSSAPAPVSHTPTPFCITQISTSESIAPISTPTMIKTITTTTTTWHEHPHPQSLQSQIWLPQGCVPGPLPTHLVPVHLPLNRLHRHRPQQQQQQQLSLPQPSPQPQLQPPTPPPAYQLSQPQTTQRPQSRTRPRSRSPPARPENRPQSPPPARPARSQYRNPQPAPRNPSRSRSRSPFPHGEDAGRRTFLKNIAHETIAAINNHFVDVTTTQKHTQLFLENSQELADWGRSRPRNSFNHTTQIEVLALSTLQGARYLNTEPHPKRKIGVLNFASATKPGGEFLNGAGAQEESIARSSSLYASLITDIANPFYALHVGKAENNGFYTHAMIYSPNVHLFRDDDGGWMDPLPVDIVTSPAVNAGKVRGSYYPGKRLEQKIEDAMCEHMARVLALFEMKGPTSLVLGSFGTGGSQNDVGAVARIWRDLLINPGARFKSTFREVVFCIPDEQTREAFKNALYSRGAVGGRGRSVRVDRGGDNVP